MKSNNIQSIISVSVSVSKNQHHYHPVITKHNTKYIAHTNCIVSVKQIPIVSGSFFPRPPHVFQRARVKSGRPVDFGDVMDVVCDDVHWSIEQLPTRQ